MELIKRLSCELLCNQKEIQTNFQLHVLQLTELTDKFQSCINSVDTLKGLRHEKAEKYLHRSKGQIATDLSKQQTREYFHLDKLLNQLKNQLQTIRMKNKKASEITNIIQKYDQIPSIKELINQAEESFITIETHANLIKERKFKYHDEGNSIVCECFEPPVKDNIPRSLCEEEDSRIEMKRAEYKQKEPKSQQNKPKPKDQGNLLQSLTQNQKKYLQQTFPNKELTKVYYSLTEEDFDYFQKQRNIRYSKIEKESNLCALNHSFTPVLDMQLFCAEKWKNLSCLNLVDCRIDNDRLDKFFKSFKSFPELKILFINQNQIYAETEQLQQFYDFPKLEFVYFEFEPQNITNKKKDFLRQFLTENNEKRKRKLAIYI